MTYPRTAEEKARQLGARLACEAFNACGSLDARACQAVADAFGNAIAELVRSVSWEPEFDPTSFYRPQPIYGRPLASYPPFPRDLNTYAKVTEKPSGSAWVVFDELAAFDWDAALKKDKP